MGCLTSKLASNESRIEGERNPSKRSNGFKVMEDQLVSLLCSSDKVVVKLKSEEQEDKKKLGDILGKLRDAESHYSVNISELMAGLEEEEEEEEDEKKKKKKNKKKIGEPAMQIEVIHVDDFLDSSSDEAEEDEGKEGREDTTKLESRTELGGAVCSDLARSDSMRFIVNGHEEWRRLGEETREEGSGKEEAPLRISSFRFNVKAGGEAAAEEEEEEVSGYDTPTFGSYIRSRVRQRMVAAAAAKEGEEEEGGGGGGGGVLHEELMAHLEEAMKQLRDEEELEVLKIVEDFLDKVHEPTCVD